LLVLAGEHLEPPESLWRIEDWRAAFAELRADGQAAKEFQAAINTAAKHCVESRRFATVKTWGGDDFYSPKLAAKWWVEVEQSTLLPAIRERAADLLRWRVRNLRLSPADVDWLAEALQAVDLGEEGPWVRNHLAGGWEIPE
jgi:hypothetical protein